MYHLPSNPLNFAIDETALSELLMYKECKTNLEKARQMLAKTRHGSKEHKSYTLARKIFELSLDMMNPKAVENARVIHWVDE